MKRPAERVRGRPELAGVVREEAAPSIAPRPVFAQLRPVPARVEPALEDAVRVLARVAARAAPLAKLGARLPRVVEPPRVTPPSLLARVRERTLRPVVRPGAAAPTNLKLEHAEVVRKARVRRRRVPRVRISIIPRRAPRRRGAAEGSVRVYYEPRGLMTLRVAGEGGPHRPGRFAREVGGAARTGEGVGVGVGPSAAAERASRRARRAESRLSDTKRRAGWIRRAALHERLARGVGVLERLGTARRAGGEGSRGRARGFARRAAVVRARPGPAPVPARERRRPARRRAARVSSVPRPEPEPRGVLRVRTHLLGVRTGVRVRHEHVERRPPAGVQRVSVRAVEQKRLDDLRAVRASRRRGAVQRRPQIVVLATSRRGGADGEEVARRLDRAAQRRHHKGREALPRREPLTDGRSDGLGDEPVAEAGEKRADDRRRGARAGEETGAEGKSETNEREGRRGEGERAKGEKGGRSARAEGRSRGPSNVGIGKKRRAEKTGKRPRAAHGRSGKRRGVVAPRVGPRGGWVGSSRRSAGRARTSRRRGRRGCARARRAIARRRDRRSRRRLRWGSSRATWSPSRRAVDPPRYPAAYEHGGGVTTQRSLLPVSRTSGRGGGGRSARGRAAGTGGRGIPSAPEAGGAIGGRRRAPTALAGARRRARSAGARAPWGVEIGRPVRRREKALPTWRTNSRRPRARETRHDRRAGASPASERVAGGVSPRPGGDRGGRDRGRRDVARRPERRGPNRDARALARSSPLCPSIFPAESARAREARDADAIERLERGRS